jgi:hypothetical protein
MKAVLLCNDSPNQRALANRLHAVLPLAAIARVSPLPGKFRPGLLHRAELLALSLPLRRAWKSLQAHYDKLFPGWPEAPISDHRGVNSRSVAELVERLAPDLVIVSGTDLLKQELIDTASRNGRVVNLHTGISPYIKGGPSCTNWCLATGQPELIGNTVMWIDKGIDSGNIIATERTPLCDVRTLTALHIAVMDHAHDLLARVVERLRDGAPLPSVPQTELGKGRLFLTRHWTGRQALRAWQNFRKLRPLSARSSNHAMVALADRAKPRAAQTARASG